MVFFSWPIFHNSVSLSFVNDSICTGIHQRALNDVINLKLFENDRANQFYETFIILNLPPKYVKFGDQNKTKFISTRQEFESLIKFEFNSRQIRQYKNSIYYKSVQESIDEFENKNSFKKLKKAKKENKIKISEKYFSSTRKGDLFICEGISAIGSLLQARDPQTQAAYALRGKVKNVRTIEDLSGNTEIVELINILNLDVENHGSTCDYKRVIVAVDGDFDGSHIFGLLLNFFHKWFKETLRQTKIYGLNLPLLSVDKNKKRTYYYSLKEFEKEKTKENVRYLKGLGSLDLQDWEYAFSNLDNHLIKIKLDNLSDKYIDIAFGDNSELRKVFLQIT
jgi:DNA gyrase/topoisomerase IV subunit B